MREARSEVDLARILMVADDFVSGGAFKVAERLAHGFVKEHRLEFVCDWSSLNQKAREALGGAGVKVARLFAHAGEMRRATCDLDSASAMICRSMPEKIVFVDSSARSNIATKDAARDLKIPYISIVNFVDRETPAPLKIWDADVARAASAAHSLVFVSAAAMADFDRNFPDVTTPRTVVANGVPDEFFQIAQQQVRSSVRDSLKVAEKEVLLLLAGRLEPRKGQHLAVSAVKLLSLQPHAPSVQLLLAGFGDVAERSALEKLVKLLGVESRVHFLGYRSDLPQLMEACDIVLMPSLEEADPLVSKEAMAVGRPVVASDLPAFRDQGHPKELLFPFEEDSPEKTTEAIVDIVDGLRRNAAKRARIGRDLQEIAKNRHTMAKMFEAYSRILQTMPSRTGSTLIKSDPTSFKFDLWENVSESRQIRRVFKDGWSEVEDGGIWSVRENARIAFLVEKPVCGMTLTLQCGALAARGHKANIEVIVNTLKVGTVSFSNRKRTTRTLQINVPKATRRFVIRFYNANPASPVALGLNQDWRTLGLRIFSLRISENQHAEGSETLWQRPDIWVLRRLRIIKA